jgi:hypothetical protein
VTFLRRDPANTGPRASIAAVLSVAVAFFLLGAVIFYQLGTRRAPRYQFTRSSSGIPLRLDTITGKIEVVLPEPLPVADR